MKSEAEIRELHQRLTKVLSYTRSLGVKLHEVRELVALKVSLEYLLGMDTASAKAWQAATFRGIHNLEALQKTAERSRQARDN